jgi:hypothetical protein
MLWHIIFLWNTRGERKDHIGKITKQLDVTVVHLIRQVEIPQYALNRQETVLVEQSRKDV